MVYSATRGPTPPYDLSSLKKEIMFLLIGAVVLTAIAGLDSRRLRDYAPGIYGGTCFLMLLVIGVPSRYLLAIVLVGGLGAAVVLSSGLLADYQKDRLTTFIDQGSASSKTSSRTDAYNLEQSKIAIGSGGSVGKGLFKGPQ